MMMLKSMFTAARRALIILAVLIVAAPFIVYGGTIALFVHADWQAQQRKERYLVGSIYSATYSGAEEVVLRENATIPRSNQPLGLEVHLSPPALPPTPEALAQLSRDVRLRAARLGEDECKAFVQLLASSCRVLSSKAGGGSKSILLKLEVEQKTPQHTPGRPASSERDVLQVDYVDIRPGESAAGRWELYARIADDCRQQKATFGNCTLLDVSARSKTYPSRDGGMATRTDVSLVMAVRRNFDVAALMKEGRRGL